MLILKGSYKLVLRDGSEKCVKVTGVEFWLHVNLNEIFESHLLWKKFNFVQVSAEDLEMILDEFLLIFKFESRFGKGLEMDCINNL